MVSLNISLQRGLDSDSGGGDESSFTPLQRHPGYWGADHSTVELGCMSEEKDVS